jgi:hypothetical protein
MQRLYETRLSRFRYQPWVYFLNRPMETGLVKNLALAAWCFAWIFMLYLLLNIANLFVSALFHVAWLDGEVELVLAYAYLLIFSAYVCSAIPRFSK